MMANGNISLGAPRNLLAREIQKSKALAVMKNPGVVELNNLGLSSELEATQWKAPEATHAVMQGSSTQPSYLLS